MHRVVGRFLGSQFRRNLSYDSVAQDRDLLPGARECVHSHLETRRRISSLVVFCCSHTHCTCPLQDQVMSPNAILKAKLGELQRSIKTKHLLLHKLTAENATLVQRAEQLRQDVDRAAAIVHSLSVSSTSPALGRTTSGSSSAITADVFTCPIDAPDDGLPTFDEAEEDGQHAEATLHHPHSCLSSRGSSCRSEARAAFAFMRQEQELQQLMLVRGHVHVLRMLGMAL